MKKRGEPPPPHGLISYTGIKYCYTLSNDRSPLDELTATNLSFFLGAAALALFFVGDGFFNDDDDDSSDGGLMQPVAASS